jgi:hypothetical protein
MMMFRQVSQQFGIGLGLMLLSMGLAWANEQHPTVEVILSTPVSSRISRVGSPVRAVLREVGKLGEEMILPPGTLLQGRVERVESSNGRQEGRIQLVFTEALLPTGEVDTVNLIPDTPDGWIRRLEGVALTACKIMPGHSTRLLNNMVRRRLPCDRSLWAQVLGMNSSEIPDPSTDEFMERYNRRDVLLGAGDWLRLRVYPYPAQYLPE